MVPTVGASAACKTLFHQAIFSKGKNREATDRALKSGTGDLQSQGGGSYSDRNDDAAQQ
jgi:hypothetical protein